MLLIHNIIWRRLRFYFFSNSNFSFCDVNNHKHKQNNTQAWLPLFILTSDQLKCVKYKCTLYIIIHCSRLSGPFSYCCWNLVSPRLQWGKKLFPFSEGRSYLKQSVAAKTKVKRLISERWREELTQQNSTNTQIQIHPSEKRVLRLDLRFDVASSVSTVLKTKTPGCSVIRANPHIV